MPAGNVAGGGFHPTFVWVSLVESSLGVVFNAIVLYLGYANPHLRRDTATLLQLMLAVVDLTTTGLILGADIEHLWDQRFEWGDAACARFGVGVVLLFGLSITLLSLIALDRYSLLVRLRRLRRRVVKKLFVAANSVVLIGAFMPLMGLGQYSARPELSFCIVDWQARDAGGVLFSVVVMGFVGGSVAWVGTSYWRMFAAVRHALRMRLAITQSSATYAKEVRTARRLCVMAAVYVAAWLPLSLSLLYEFMLLKTTSVEVDIFVYLAGYSNCVFNPVLLVFMHVHFRRAFASLAADCLMAVGLSSFAQRVVVWRNHQSGASRATNSGAMPPNSDIRGSLFYSSFADQVLSPQPVVSPPPAGGARLVRVMPVSVPEMEPRLPVRVTPR